MTPYTPLASGNQPILVTGLEVASPEVSWRAHKALLEAMVAEPELRDDPLWQHFMRVAYVRFEQAIEVAA